MRTELEIRHLRVFLAVVETGAHTRAARSLGISQSTVSETLSALERTLGTALLRKTSKGATLTPSGETLLPYAREILALTGQVVTELAKVSTHVSGTLVVAAVESISAYVLPSRLAALRVQWPKARIEVVTASCPEIRESVAAGKSDVGFVIEADTDADEDDTILARGRLLLLASPSHLLARRGVTPDALLRGDVYTSDVAGDYIQMLRHYLEAAQVAPLRTQSLGNVEGVKRGVLAGGDALGLLPAHAVTRELEEGVLAEVTMTPPLPRLVMRAVFPPGHATSPMVDELVASLRDSLRVG